jgi:lia operon protein LiaF
MFKHLKTDTFNWILIIGVILFILELAFFHGGMIASAIFSAVFIYAGWKNFSQLWGKILFWLGIVAALFSILNMLAVRFLVLAAIVIFLINYSKSKQEAERIHPQLSSEQEVITDPLIKTEPLFDHQIFGDQKTDDTAYGWRDINIHGAFGDRVIDLSNTVLPDDTAVISIRHAVGNIEILIPYEVEVSVQHSAVFGRAHIFGENNRKLINKSLLYRTPNYDTASSRIKIVTTVLSGDIEVKRI